MRFRLMSLCLGVAAVGFAGCSSNSTEQTTAQAPAPAAPTKPALGIKPFGTADPNFKPDYSKLDPQVAKAFEQIDQNIDFHVGEFQKWLQQPSISNSGEGIPESAEMVKGFFEELGCQFARVYDTGVDPTGSAGSPGGFKLSYRQGAIAIPHLAGTEPLRLECQHFVACIRDGRRPLSDGESGLRVVRVLEGLQRSLDETRRAGVARVGA